MQRLGEQSRHLSSTSTDLQSSSQNLSSATTEQAAAIQETASSIEEMSAMVKKSSENANRSRDVATSSAQVANRGKQTVEEMLQSIGEINISNEKIMKAIETSNRQISEIVGVIREIGNKTKVINDIVFQTKLLSFNASVEAARAGEHGKGFAVVAEEVGNLAQMSGNAAKEIGDMLGGSIQKVEKIVHETKTQVERLVADGKSKVDAGSVVAKQCAEILDEMVKNVNEVKEMIGEISTAAQEQSQGVSEITKAMNQLDQATHENAGTSQEAATFSNQIKTEAEQLVHEVTILRNLVEGVQGMSVTSVAPPKPEVSKSLKVARAKTEESPSPELKTFGKDDVKEVEASVARPMASRARAVGAEDLPHENDPRFQDI
jgi:methyl-accepting chemotaxis protein